MMVEKVECIEGWMRSVVVWRRSSKSKRRWKEDVKGRRRKSGRGLSIGPLDAYVISSISQHTYSSSEAERPVRVVGAMNHFHVRRTNKSPESAETASPSHT